MTAAGPRRPRVLFVGSAKYDLPIRESLAKKWDRLAERFDVRVIGRAGAVKATDERFRLIDGSGPAGSFQMALPRLVAAEARDFRPDVVIAQSPYEAFPVLAARAAVRPRPKLVVEVHGDWRTATRLYGSRGRLLFAPLADRAALAALRRADGTRALSTFTAGLVKRATGREPLAVFPTFTDLESFVKEPPHPLPPVPTAAWVGVLQRSKGPELLVRAWRMVAERVPEARLIVVGDGPLRPQVDRLVEEQDGRVTAIPRLTPPEVADVLDRSTLLVLPTPIEGLGRVAIEALVRGRPVVGSDSGGIPDIVTTGRNGLLVPPNDVNALAGALVRSFEDRPLVERMAAAAHEDAPRFIFSPDEYADAMRDLVERALATA